MMSGNEVKDLASKDTENVSAFRKAYKRLNYKQQQKEQKAFCEHHEITPGGFRARLAGTVRVSDSELVYLEARVETYFPQKAAAA